MTAADAQALVVGCGYVGQRLIARLGPRYEVVAVVRSTASASLLRSRGIRTLTLDLDEDRECAEVRLPQPLERQAVVYLAPPPGEGESDPRLGRFLELLGIPPQYFIYVSTTGVYGDAQGGTVDESTPVQPRSARARRRVSAEEMIRVWCHERQVRRVVLRVPGIYGPGRLPLAALRRHEPVVREQEAGIGNRIHVDDLVQACLAALSNREAQNIYNVTDGQPLSSSAFFRKVAEAAGITAPPQVSMDEAQLTFSPERLAFLAESRRVCNQRMLNHLGVKLRYADTAKGILASLREAAGSQASSWSS